MMISAILAICAFFAWLVHKAKKEERAIISSLIESAESHNFVTQTESKTTVYAFYWEEN